MALINWEYLDKEHAILCQELLDKKIPKDTRVDFSKVVAQNSKSKQAKTPFEEWEEYLAKNKGSMPTAMREILETITYTGATKQVALSKFALSLAEYWADMRTEIKQLESHNATLVAERQNFRKQEFKNALKS